MNLENSGFLWLLLVIPCFLYYATIFYVRASTWLYRFAHIKKQPVSYAVSTLFYSLALGALIFTLTEPKVQYNKIVFNRGGIDVAIGIDVSKSMLAEDEMVPEEGKSSLPYLTGSTARAIVRSILYLRCAGSASRYLCLPAKA